MSEFVRKTMMGYKEVPGGHSDSECTHVILSLREYDQIIREKDQALRNVDIEKERANRNIEEAKRNASYLVRKEKERVDIEVGVLREGLEKALQEVDYQRRLNENLLRIARERANADREIKPKKEHTGYVVIASGEKEIRKKDSRRGSYYYIKLWETVLQTPYSVEFSEEQARRQICEDLMKSEEGKDWMLARIGIYEKPKQKPFSIYGDDDDEEEAEEEDLSERDNILLRYRLRANYQARKDKELGFWEIVLTHKKSLLRVPRDMRSG